MVNPVRTKSFAKSIQLRTKNDKVDSQMIAHYTFLHNPTQTPKVPKDLQHFRRLETLVEDRAKELMRIKSALDSDVKQLINKRINFLKILLEEFVKPYGLTQKQLCEKLNVGIKTISEIYNKKRGISPVMALKLANLFGTTPEFWLNAQCYYDLHVAYEKEKENIDKIQKIA